jgi:thioredoxin reductase
VAAHGPCPDAGVAGRWHADKFIEWYLVGAGQRQEQFQGRLAAPDSSRDSVLTEMPVAADTLARVAPRCWRSARKRGPTAPSTGSSGMNLLPLRQTDLSTIRPAAHRGRMNDSYDVVVIGGGAAGLAGAVALARSRRSVLVVDAGEPRNAPAAHVHNFLTRDGTPPSQIYEAGRAELTSYGGHVETGRVTALSRDGDRFAVQIGGRAVTARRLLAATGLRDELPDVPGLAERWGIDVLHCPYCHGWEVRDQRIGILATGPAAAHQALLFRQLSPHVTVLAHIPSELTPEQQEQFGAVGIGVIEGPVTGIEADDGGLTGVRLADGTRVSLDALIVAPRMTANAELLAPLGLTPTEVRMGEQVMGTQIEADPSGATSVPGVWVAGNLANIAAQVITSAAGGLTAGAAINADLAAEDAKRAAGTTPLTPATTASH